MLTIALIGLGAIGNEVLKRLAASDARVRVAAALVARADGRSHAACPVVSDFEQLIAARPDFVIECARQHVLKAFGARVLASGASLIAASVGALADEAACSALQEAAQSGGSQLFIPAGALAGIDALAAAREVGLSNVAYVRRAPPATWVKSGALSMEQALMLNGAHTVFEGSAREAATRYPKNANVAATVALAGIGFDRTRVRLFADTTASSNVHAIEAEGEFGSFRTEMSARPLEGSTSSAIVAGSLVHALLSRTARISV